MINNHYNDIKERSIISITSKGNKTWMPMNHIIGHLILIFDETAEKIVNSSGVKPLSKYRCFWCLIKPSD